MNCNDQVRQDERKKRLIDLMRPREGAETVLKIEKQSDGRTTIIWLIGRIRAEHLGEIKKQIDDGSGQTVLDLGEVTIVDTEVVHPRVDSARTS